MVKAVLFLLLLCACERADPPPKAPPPTPVKPDPIDPVRQAHDEFELIPADYAIGTHKLYSRGDLMPAGADLEDQFDEGDFIGRLRTLFGARDGDEYVLRHKATGYVITAYSGGSGPSFGGGPRYPGALPPADPKALMQAAFARVDDPAVAARKAADPVLAKAATAPRDFGELQEVSRHMGDADAGPELAAAVRRLEALIDAVPPADWEKTMFYDEAPGVYRIGAKHGHSFNEELPPADAFAFLVKDAESRDPTERDDLGGIPFDADSAVLMFYTEHEDELADQRPRALAAYRRLLAEAKSYTGDLRASLLDEARDYARKLHVAAP
jgi:hypothetical protein